MKFKQVILLIFIFAIHANVEASFERKKVLILHSYHQGLKWTDNINHGLQDIFTPLNYKIDLNYEYLNTKKNISSKYSDDIFTLLRKKLKNENYDIIIVIDNNALEFVKKHRLKLFKNTPIIFCGINNYEPEMTKGLSKVTVITEQIDFRSNLKIIESALPNTKYLAIISDNKTTTSKLNLKTIRKLEKEKYSRLKFIYYDDIKMSNLQEKVSHIKGDTAVLLLSFNQDKSGKYYSYQDNYNYIVSKCKAPLFVVWEFSLQKGVLGGKVISGQHMGTRTAELALNILYNKEQINIENESFDRIVFDYKSLQKHNIKLDNLPEDSIIINKPYNLYTDNKNWIQTIITLIFVSICIILILLKNINKRKIAEKALLNEQKKLNTAIKHERLMSSIARILNSNKKISDNIDLILSLLSRKLDINRISIFRLKPEDEISKGIKNRIAIKGEDIIISKDIDINALRYIFTKLCNNKSIISNNLQEVPKKELAFFHSRNIKSIVMLPLRIENKSIAFLAFSLPETHVWTHDELRLFTLTANMISLIWEQKKQHKRRIEAEQRNLESLRLLEQSSRMASVGVMAAGITHEINQPLNSIKINADSVLFWNKRNPEILPEIFIKKIKTISDESLRIDSIIKHMRLFWEHPKAKEKKIINMNTSLRQAISLIKRQVSDHSIDLIEDISEKQVCIQANTIQFEQIVINLVVNAIHSLDTSDTKNKYIKISAYEETHYAILEIHDNGNGIPKNIWDKIYDPLFTTKTEDKGMGLGMAIVKSFVEKFDGEISNYNNIDGGVSFVMKFKKK